ncbi:MAG: DUF2290 domain-containing protein [Candidatus Marithrix sp.]
MTPRQLRNDLQNAYDLFLEKKISIYNQPIAYEQNGSTIRISWHQSNETLAKPKYFGTFKQYLSIVKDDSYSCLLADGGLLRISYTFKRNRLVAHNLWYYPCPLDLPRKELLIEPLIDLAELYAEAGIDCYRFGGPIRFDYDSERIEEIVHPATHVHFIRENCRMPVKRPLSPGTFLKFIFLNFYPELWDSFEFLRDLPEETFKQTIFVEEEKLIHFSWR